MMRFFSCIFLLLIIGCTSTQNYFEPPNNSRTMFKNSLGMEFVYINPGEFLMGIPPGYFGYDHGQNPRHKVKITKGFYMMTTEVTQKQWEDLMGNNPSFFKKCGQDCPVETVSWMEVQSFISQLNKKEKSIKYRLPTEAEWEYAARAGTDTPYYYGTCLSSYQANFRATYPTFLSTHCPRGKYRGGPIAVASLSE